MIQEPPPGARPLPLWLAPAFFISGFAALVYQVAWQRVLFANFGITIESVTLVVTGFLLGLGLGSIAGGIFSARWHGRQLLFSFALLELLVGAYGAISRPLFPAVAAWSAGAPPAIPAALSVILVVLPTTAMGASLPLLVAYAVRVSGNVGMSVGWLYFVNTAGSAIASMMAVFVLLPRLGLSRSIIAAVATNMCVAILTLAAAWAESAE